MSRMSRNRSSRSRRRTPKPHPITLNQHLKTAISKAALASDGNGRIDVIIQAVERVREFENKSSWSILLQQWMSNTNDQLTTTIYVLLNVIKCYGILYLNILRQIYLIHLLLNKSRLQMN